MQVNVQILEFVIMQGIHPDKAVQVARQIQACARAGIGATINDTWEAWKRVNQPTLIRDQIVGGRRA